MQVLFDAIGEENFEALNNLVNEDYQATDAYTKTTLHDNIEKRRDSILKKMEKLFEQRAKSQNVKILKKKIIKKIIMNFHQKTLI